MIRAVIFDLDGTLADSLGDIGGAMNETLRERGLPEHPPEAYRLMVGEGIEVLARRALAGAAVELSAFVARYRERYALRIEQLTRPYPGVADLLDELTARGLKLAVLSNKRDDFTVELVRRQFGRWPFAEVRGEREGVPRKPDPTAATQIARALGTSAEHTAFVGDTAIDIKTAVAAGMQPVGVLWGFRGRDELLAAGATTLLERPEQFLRLLP